MKRKRNVENFTPEIIWTNLSDREPICVMDAKSIQYLYLTLKQSKQQLQNSNSFLYHPDDAIEEHQRLVNKMLSDDLNAMIQKLEQEYPNLKELNIEKKVQP